MTNLIDINEARSYATKANLEKAIAKFGFDDYRQEESHAPMRYMMVRNDEGRWTAIFLVSQYFRHNKTGGYIAFVAEKGFTSI